MSKAVDQRLDALANAQAIRLARAQLRRRVREGEVSLTDVIAEPPPEARTATVVQVLKWRRGVADRLAAKVCGMAGVSELRPVGSLTLRQRAQLAAALGARGLA